MQTTLGEIAEWGSGGTPKRSVIEYFGPGTPWLSIADLNDGIVLESTETLTEAGIANSAAKVVPKGTIFIAMYGSIGKLGIAGREFCTSQAIAFAKPKTEIVDTRFLFHYLLAERNRFQAIGRGGTQKNISQRDLKSWPISLPSLAEQIRISEMLDRAEAIREKRFQSLVRVQELEQAIFYDMFGDDRQGQIRLGDLVSVQSGGTPSKKTPEYWNGGIPWFSPKDIKTVNLHDSQDHVTPLAPELTNLRVLPENTIVLVVRGMILAHTLPISTLRVPGTINQDLKALIPKKDLDVDFLAAALRSRSKRLLSRTTTSAHGTRRLETAELMETLIPDVAVTEQRLFAQKMARVNVLESSVEATAQLESELFASLQSRAFRGEL